MLTNESSPDEVAATIIAETKRRGYSRDESIACVSTGLQESGLRMVWDSGKRWFGYFQQDGSYPNRFDPMGNILGFLDRLDQKRRSPGASSDPFKTIFWLQQRPSDPSADTAYARGRKAYYDEIRRHIGKATDLYNRHSGQPAPPPPPPPPAPQSYGMPRGSKPGGPATALPPTPARPAVTVQRHGDPIWLPDVLRAEGLTVNEVPGWRERGHGDFGEIRGIMAHHTGSNNASPESIAFHPSLGLASQLHLARNGVWTVCGVGIAWHAGNGGGIPWLPNNDANRFTIGIEAANDGGGTPGKPHRSSWPAEQYDSYVRGCAAILRKIGQG